jgi:phage shock protein B
VDNDSWLAVPILFILTVLPLWLILHYRSRREAPPMAAAPGGGPGSAELAASADKMEKRIAALEAVLDAESPGWRQRHSHD